MTPENYMQKALLQAKIAYKNDEVPVGAIIIDNKTGEIVARAHNITEHKNNCTGHAEILAIQKACKKTNLTRLRNMDIYVTLEPCTMCAAAISYARIENVYFATLDEKNGAICNGVKFYESKTCHHKPNIFYGILQDEASQLLKNFFKNKRQ